VYDGVGAVEGAADRGVVADIAGHELELRVAEHRQDSSAAVGQVVQYPDLMVFLKQELRQDRAKIPGTACYQNLHYSLILYLPARFPSSP
jgi:hypothetical protein